MVLSLRTALFGRKKTRPFKDYYAEWFDTLKNNHLPHLRRSLRQPSSSSSATFITHVEVIHHHLLSYYESLDNAASNDVAQVLFPEWRTSLEKPFLWLGDLHPYVFINLLRSFLEDKNSKKDDETEEDDNDNSVVFGSSEHFGIPWNFVTAWKSPSDDLTTKIEEIERGLRLMVPAVVVRARTAQEKFVEKVGAEWMNCLVKKEGTKGVVGEAMKAEMEEMVSVFLDANRLRRSVLTDILSAVNVYQAALFLERVSQFFVGFRDHGLLSQFEDCNMPMD